MAWIARYEEGFVTRDGADHVVTTSTHHYHPWPDPSDALDQWSSRVDLRGPAVSRYGNGLMQVDDVSADARFRRLGIATIWRRVTFVPK